VSRERAGHTLQTPRSSTKPTCGWSINETTAAAAQLMRRIMVDHARERHSLRRGGGALKKRQLK
jgi:hypothetical protein